MGCAIFGITEVPTDGVEFDTGDQPGEGSPGEPPIIPVHTQAAPQQSSSPYIPHPHAAAGEGPSGGLDPERGEVFGSPELNHTPAVAIPNPTSLAPAQPPLDLLDSNAASAPKTDDIGGGAIHELD